MLKMYFNMHFYYKFARFFLMEQIQIVGLVI